MKQSLSLTLFALLMAGYLAYLGVQAWQLFERRVSAEIKSAATTERK